jgi:short-subunit dehydrogenase
LKNVESQCRQINPKIQTLVIQADFSKDTSIAFYQEIYDQVKDLDIAVLINDAGVFNTGYFDNMAVKQIKDMLDVNVVHVSMMTSLFIDKLLKRKKKSALINVSSGVGYQEGSSGSAVYCASKNYVNKFTVALAKELEGRIDIQCLTPWTVQTTMLEKTSLKGITPDKVVRGSLRDLGDFYTGGHWSHDIQMWAFRVLSRQWIV